ncbi:Lrp/AsnC family transcriptional regulator [Streptomyces sp. HC44]|uniref:Lrp/AsnC family transcriptional regulator n=1 Tax=Streptomyces scabichelini TaxID=2711217 RepID=A0A6G4VMK0_9ACTN|nr:Lrp/AsnC family transcriptional regulator [Streptomyces scabichelini]NGO15326.1 Lrp/AsnC family transcriptional regulator [Streptomyces scabichelini]
MFDTMDFAIVNALQINPRISWAQLGQLLTVDPSTLSRRWSRVTREGRAWSSCFHVVNVQMKDLATAVVQIGCEPGRRESVIEQLSGEAPVVTIHCTSGARDLVLTVSLPGRTAVDRYVDQVIAAVPGVRRMETSYMRRVFKQGTDWRPYALTTAQARAVAATLPSAPADPKPNAFLLELIAAIGDDVRRPISELQRRVGRSLSAVSRGVDTLLMASWANWRIDFSHALGGWEEVMLWLDVPQNELENVAGTLRRLPQLRWCSSITGTANMIATVCLRDLAELDEIEGRLAVGFPMARVTDRCVVPRIAKRMGHVIGYDSRLERYVPFGAGQEDGRRPVGAGGVA